ncbi:MAG: M50 family metallopeptidase [Gammaproteobacteria bacterium]|nr:M50 family metallopeptidase [Gammaproteobacteria bacterium]
MNGQVQDSDASTVAEAERGALWPPPEPAPLPLSKGGWKPRLRSALVFCGWLALGAAFGYAATALSWEISGMQWLVGTLAFIFAGWLNLILHEAGHALAGIAFGQRAYAFGIGSWRLERGQAGWHVRKGGAISGVGGFAALAPRAGRAGSRRDMVAFLLGGPFANLLTGAAGLALLHCWQPPALLAAALVGAVLSALLLGVVNLLPFRSKGWYSDGLNLLHLLRNNASARARIQATQLLGLSLAGVRPRDWPPQLLPDTDTDTEDGDPALVSGLLALHLVCAIDQDEREAADLLAQRLAPMLYDVPEAMRAALAVNIAFHIACFRPDAKLLAAWLPHCEGGLLDVSAQRELLQAEHRLLLGDDAASAEHLARASDSMHRVQDAGSAQMLADRIQVLRARLAG